MTMTCERIPPFEVVYDDDGMGGSFIQREADEDGRTIIRVVGRFGRGKTTALGAVADIHRAVGREVYAIGNVRTYEHKTSREGEPRLHLHNVLFNVAPRRIQIAADPSNPVPLAGTVFDPRRYRRP